MSKELTKADLIAAKQELKEKLDNLRLDMKDCWDFEAFNKYRLEYEKLQLQSQILDSELNITFQIGEN